MGKTRYLTPEEAAEILRVTPRTVYEWLRTGKLRARKIGRKWHIPSAEVYLEEEEAKQLRGDKDGK